MILLRGPCDITAISTYIKKRNVVVESAIKGKYLDIVWDCSLSTYLAQSANGMEINSHFVDPAYYIDHGVFHGKYEAIVISVIGEGLLGIYENKNDKTKIAYGLWTSDATYKDGELYFDSSVEHGGISGIEQTEYADFSKKYKFLGRIKPSISASNYECFIKKIPNTCRVIILLGPTKNVEFEKNPALKDASAFYKELNETIVKRLFAYENVSFLFPDNFICSVKSKKDMFYYNYPSILHYPCVSYYNIAKYLSKDLQGKISVSKLRFIMQKIKRLCKRIR